MNKIGIKSKNKKQQQQPPIAIMNSTTDDYSFAGVGYCNNQHHSFRPTGTIPVTTTPIRASSSRKYTAASYKIRSSTTNNPLAYPGPVSFQQRRFLKSTHDSIEKRRMVVENKSLFRVNTPSSLMTMHSSPVANSKLSMMTSSQQSNGLKDHQFTVINHKSESIFEPKSASTPIYHREHKTSTPNMLNRTLLENVLFRLAASTSNSSSGENNYAVVVNRQAKKLTAVAGKDSNRHSDYFTGSSSNRLDEDEDAYDVPEPRVSENDYQIPNQCLKRDVGGCENKDVTEVTTTTTTTTATSHLRNHKKSESESSLKNLTVVSAASSVRSSVVQCCIKPFRIFSSHTKGVKKCLKKF